MQDGGVDEMGDVVVERGVDHVVAGIRERSIVGGRGVGGVR